MRNTQSVPQSSEDFTSPLNETLIQGASQLDTEDLSQARLLEAQKEERERKAIQLEQHNKINPPDQHDVFVADEKKTTKELIKNRQGIAQILADKGNEDVELQKPLISQITNTGREGIGLKGYFDKLAITVRDLIPQSELEVFNGKQAKLRGYRQTADVQNSITNNESNLHRGGGQ
jgi:hypothetical protein